MVALAKTVAATTTVAGAVVTVPAAAAVAPLFIQYAGDLEGFIVPGGSADGCRDDGGGSGGSGGEGLSSFSLGNIPT